MKILITGGAGYIGSCAAHQLVDAGHEVVVLDMLDRDWGTGNRWAVPEGAQLVQGNCGDKALLRSLGGAADRGPGKERFDALMHFAASMLVFESVEKPASYYENNVVNSLRLFEYAIETGIPSIVFSSTAATYGEPDFDLIPETAPLAPVNPYGASKVMSERMLRDLCAASGGSKYSHGSRFIALRYFNPAGAFHDLRVGQARGIATHLVPVAAEAAIGKREKVLIHGTDYPTPDGTCQRDYIHIQDLVDAHMLAVEHLARGGESDVFNVGYGRPYSVREVIETMRRVSLRLGGRDFDVVTGERRPGDPARLAADPTKIKRVLGWKPKLDSLEAICESHFLWEQKRAGGVSVT